MTISTKTPDISKTTALKFVLLLSIVDLFADMTYEGARSITGPFMAILGANAAIVGFVAGLGEFVGYALRIVSGYLADRFKQYWIITIFGYACNLLAVPLLALAGHWWMAAVLIVMERMGKAIRVPPRDAMLAHAGQRMGMGWVFGLHEAIDQIGAMVGPLIVAVVMYYQGHHYQYGFAVLLVPALLALTILLLARFMYPHPQSLEITQEFATQGIPKPFWLYLSAAALIAAGYADFPLIAFHFQKQAIVSPIVIPIAYSVAMGLSAITALLLGHFYDRRGFSVLIVVTVSTCVFAPLVFFGNESMSLIGVALWSIGMGAQESLMRAIVANMVSKDRRASAYGVFNTGYGFCWFLGSCVMGILYDVSILSLVLFSMGIQLLAVPLLWMVMKNINVTTE